LFGIVSVKYFVTVNVAGPLRHWSSSLLGLARTLDALHTGVWRYSRPYSVMMQYVHRTCT